jgi:UDP-glucose 4-epimerase
MPSPDVCGHAENPTSLAGNRCVLLGGTGFLGTHLARALHGAGARVRVLARRSGHGAQLPADTEWRYGDIGDGEAVLAALDGAQTAVHLVHTTVPGSSMADPAADVAGNLCAALSWLPRLQETGLRTLVFVSSGGAVYGIPRSETVCERHPTEPISSYGVTKLALEKYCRIYCAAAGVRCIILRPSNVYGPGQRLDKGQGVIGTLAHRALTGRPLDVWGEGRQVRDYVFVDDFAQAVLRVLAYRGEGSVFNVASGIGRTVMDVIEELKLQIGGGIAIRHLPGRPFDVPRNVLDSTFLQRETGWMPRVDLHDGIALSLERLRLETSLRDGASGTADG